MVNPIAAGHAAAPYALPPDIERPASLPEPAVQVTRADQALNSGTATSGHRLQDLPEGMDPLGEALKALNSNMEAWSTGMRFDMDPEAQRVVVRSEEHTSELQSLMRTSYAVFCLKKKTHTDHSLHANT